METQVSRTRDLNNGHDKSYYLGDEPRIKACIMHQHILAVETFKAESPDHDFGGVMYGLCFECIQLKQGEVDHQEHIDLEIKRRLKLLKGDTNE